MCLATLTLSAISITQSSSSVTIALVSKTDVSCKNGSDGIIQVSAGGGTSPYMFSLNGGIYTSNSTFVNLTAGTYTVTVKDANGCTNSISVTIKNGIGKCSTTAITSATQPTSILIKASPWLKVQAVPNPTTTAFRLLMQSNSNEKVEIVVTAMYGKKFTNQKEVLIMHTSLEISLHSVCI